MRRWWLRALLLALCCGTLGVAFAQGDTRAKLGDPPIAALIGISPPDGDGMVTISGAAGAVFPAAQVSIRNLFTDETAYVKANNGGGFTAKLYGPGQTPFWISPAQTIPPALRDQPSALLGGPGTIIYGTTAPQPVTDRITRLAVDGDLGDWAAYPDSNNASGVYALLNRESLYLALQDLPSDYGALGLTFSLNNNDYLLSFDPRTATPAQLQRTAPTRADLPEIPLLATVNGGSAEVRFALRVGFKQMPSAVMGNQLLFLDTAGNASNSRAVNVAITANDEIDGIFRPSSIVGERPTPFIWAGAAAGGHWSANGRVNQTSLQTGETLALELDVTLNGADTAPTAPLLVNVSLQPITTADRQQTTHPLYNNGWSAVRTASGLGVSNVQPRTVRWQVTVDPHEIIQRDGQISFPISLQAPLPNDLPAGIYKLILSDFHSATATLWGTKTSPLPLVFNIGDVTGGNLLFSLFQDAPAINSVGLLSEADSAAYALVDRVHFSAPTLILPPVNSAGDPLTYPLEPYLLNQLSNAYGYDVPPALPFLLPGGRITVRVTRPDGGVDDLGSSAIFQNQLSTATLDEKTDFGAGEVLNAFRLTTLNPAFTAYAFSQFGEYQIELAGQVEGVSGNVYSGGGVYHVLSALPLNISPATLTGTPLEVGDTLALGLHIEPAFPADVQMRVQFYPLDGSLPPAHTVQGQANSNGVFYAPGLPITLAGEYTVDYDVRYTDGTGRLWAASLRSAGVIAQPNSPLTVHGGRGGNQATQAWFERAQLNNPSTPIPLPYHSGDVAWLAADASGQMLPNLQVQDVGGAYTDSLAQAGLDVTRAAIEGRLPVPYSADAVRYSLFSAVTADAPLRQFVSGGEGLAMTFDADDSAYSSIGGRGLNAGDTLFLFGGTVIRDALTGYSDSAIYASLAVISASTDRNTPRIAPPYQGADDGALLTYNGQAINLFFQANATRPGDILRLGETLSIAGQVAPTLPSHVSVTVTAPSGLTRHFEGYANAIGYFYQPDHDFTVDEIGVWQVRVLVEHDGITSAGRVEAPLPHGGVLGADDEQTFAVYVLPHEAEALTGKERRTDFRLPPGNPYTVTLTLPSDWKNVQVQYTLATASMILEAGSLRPSGRTINYAYNPLTLVRRFPQLADSEGRTTAPDDILRLTIYATGLDANGLPHAQSRTITLHFDRFASFG